MNDCQNWFYLCLALLGLLALLIALIFFLITMFMNYNLKLDKRTLTLEKKNGYEQHQIDQIKAELKKITTKPYETSNQN